MCSIAYDTQVSAMQLKSVETKHNNRDTIENETTKKIIEMLSQIILQNQKIQETLDKHGKSNEQ